MRKKVIVGNWKMNHTRANALAFVEGMKEEVKVAKIAKVREKISDGTTEYEDIDEAVEVLEEYGE